MLRDDVRLVIFFIAPSVEKSQTRIGVLLPITPHAADYAPTIDRLHFVGVNAPGKSAGGTVKLINKNPGDTKITLSATDLVTSVAVSKGVL